jgi:hypothetical protein
LKRLLIVLSAASLIAAMAVPSAFAGQHSFAAAPTSKFTSSSTQRALASAPSAGAENLAGMRALRAFTKPAGMSFVSGGSTNTIEPVAELPYPSEVYSENPSGTVDAATRPDDVYWFYLEAGANMTFYPEPSSQIEIKVFSSDTTDVTTQGSLPLGPGNSFTAPVSDYYFLDVHATSGNTVYTMPYDWSMSPNDNVKVDGVLAPMIKASPVSEWLDSDWDYDDVYRMPLRAGDKLTLNLAALYAYSSPNADLDLFLMGPSAASIYPLNSTNAGIVGHSINPAPAVETITYTATKTGNYFADVHSYVDDGDYSYGPSYLTWTVKPISPSISRTPSSSKVTYKRKSGVAKFTLGATFGNSVGLRVGKYKVYLQTSTNGKKWKTSYTFTTNASGAVSKNFSAKKKGTTYYRWTIKNVKGATYKSGTQKITVK